LRLKVHGDKVCSNIHNFLVVTGNYIDQETSFLCRKQKNDKILTTKILKYNFDKMLLFMEIKAVDPNKEV